MLLSTNSKLLKQLMKPLKVLFYSHAEWSSSPVFNPKRILILTKLSRYEFEKRIHKQLTEFELEQSLAARGSDYHMLLHRHNMHKTVETAVLHAFQEVGIETKLVNRLEYTDASVQWADAIVTTGGDGTYLLAASRIQNCNKPIIGFNSDPSRSKGQLCLPEKYSYNVKDAIHKLFKGMFRWQFRSRIRITLIGKSINDPPVELHDQQLMYPENRYLDIERQLSTDVTPHPVAANEALEFDLNTRVLPVLALNEVFVGECVSARVSYLEIRLDEDAPVKQKCSGLIISTGTGSTSWTYNVNKLTEQSLEQVLSIAQEESGVCFGASDSKLVSKITDKFNELLLNDPEDNRLVYTIRDQLVPPSLSILARPSSAGRSLGPRSADMGLASAASGAGTATDGGGAERVPDAYEADAPANSATVKPRGFARSIHVRSRCFDAFLVVDGGMSFSFNDGTRTLMEINPEDALRNVVLDDSDKIVTFKH